MKTVIIEEKNHVWYEVPDECPDDPNGALKYIYNNGIEERESEGFSSEVIRIRKGRPLDSEKEGIIYEQEK